MMQNEFEKLAGYKVSTETYNNIIEPMYMASNLSKEEFIKTLNKKNFALPTKRQLINKMKKLAKEIKTSSGHVETCEIETELYNVAKEEYANRFGIYGVMLEHEGFRFQYVTKAVFYNSKYETVEEIKLV